MVHLGLSKFHVEDTKKIQTKSKQKNQQHSPDAETEFLVFLPIIIIIIIIFCGLYGIKGLCTKPKTCTYRIKGPKSCSVLRLKLWFSIFHFLLIVILCLQMFSHGGG